MERMDPLEDLVELPLTGVIPADQGPSPGALIRTLSPMETAPTIERGTLPARNKGVSFPSSMAGPQYEADYLKAFDTHADALFRHAFFRLSNRERAQELTQDAFLKTWDFLRGGGDVRDFKSFLYRILNNLIIDEYRKKKSSSLDEILEDDTGAFEARMSEGGRAEAEAELDEQIIGSRIRERIDDLPEMYRTAVTMRFIDEFSPREIAELLGESENVISVRIHRGLAKLRTLCSEEHYG